MIVMRIRRNHLASYNFRGRSERGQTLVCVCVVRNPGLPRLCGPLFSRARAECNCEWAKRRGCVCVCVCVCVCACVRACVRLPVRRTVCTVFLNNRGSSELQSVEVGCLDGKRAGSIVTNYPGIPWISTDFASYNPGLRIS